MRVKLEDVCERGSSNLKQSDVVDMTGDYPVYGASGYIGNVDFYHQEKPYVAVVKDGAGIGRTTLHPAKSSVIGTMQYLLPKDNVLPEYLYYVVSYMRLEKYFTGATIPHIYFKDYKNEEFNLDSLSKQKEIIEALGKCEAIIGSRKRELELLDELIKSRFIELFGDPKYNALEWPVYLLGNLFTVGSSKRIYQSDQVQEGIPFLRISDLMNRIENKDETAELFITAELYEELRENNLVPVVGDILVTSRGTLGQCYEIREQDKFYFQDGMISWLYNRDEKITNAYLMYLFRMPGFRLQIDEVPAGSTVNYLSLVRMKNLKIMCPPLELQQQFAAFVAQVDKSKFAVQKALDETQTLFDSLMQKYFG